MELIISGINGRMGRVVLEAVAGETGLSVACGIDRAAHPDGPPRCGDAEIPVHAQAGDCPKADAIIDFSHYTAVPGLLEYAVSSGTPVCVCTTALGGDERACLHAAARSIPVFNSSNMSLGINVMAKMARLAMPAFEAGFNVEIIEKHHNQKKDSPSGTAILLADAISDACETPKEYVFGRHGKDDEVRLSQLGIHAVRGGTIPGEHTIVFAGQDEVIEVKHTAYSRKVFAHGALAAVRFLVGQPPGLYSMDDLVVFRRS